MIEVLIDDVDVSAYVRNEESSIEYEDQLNTRSTLSLTMIDVENDLVVTPGETLFLRDFQGLAALYSSDGSALESSDSVPIEAPDVVILFGGTVDRVTDTIISAPAVHQLSLDAVSFDQIADRHTVAEVYEEELVGDIVRDIVSEYLVDDLVTADGVEDGVSIAFVLFNYVTVTEALNKLGALANMIWWIDVSKVLHFQARETTTAPVALTDENDIDLSLSVTRTRARYRNREIIRSGSDLTDPLTETFVGDGERRTFNVSYPAGTEPVITLDTGSGPVSQDVGIRGVESGKDWYWNKDFTEISQDDGGTPIGATDILTVVYQGLFKVIIIVQDDAEVAARQAIEGGSGRYEHVADEPNIDSAGAAAEAAFAYLARDGSIPNTVTFVTLETGFRAGQLLPANLPREHVSGDLLITSVRGAFVEGNDQFTYTVSATDGGFVGGWVDYFGRLAATQRADLTREDELLISVRALTAPVLCGADLDLVAGAPESRIGFLQVGLGEIAA